MAPDGMGPCPLSAPGLANLNFTDSAWRRRASGHERHSRFITGLFSYTLVGYDLHRLSSPSLKRIPYAMSRAPSRCSQHSRSAVCARETLKEELLPPDSPRQNEFTGMHRTQNVASHASTTLACWARSRANAYRAWVTLRGSAPKPLFNSPRQRSICAVRIACCVASARSRRRISAWPDTTRWPLRTIRASNAASPAARTCAPGANQTPHLSQLKTARTQAWTWCQLSPARHDDAAHQPNTTG